MGGLRDTNHVTVEQSLAMFLYVIAYNLKSRVIRGIYIRSTETISMHFSIVLNRIVSLAGDYIKIPELTKEIGADDKWKWFTVSNMIFYLLFSCLDGRKSH